MSSVRWLLVDYGGVLAFSHLPDAEVQLASLFRCEISALRSAITEKSELGEMIRLDRISEGEFWNAVAGQLMGKARAPKNAGELTRLWAASYRIDPTVAQALKEVELQGARIGIATNVDRYREQHMVAAIGAAGLKAGIFPSYRLGAIKPSQVFFEQVESEIAEPSRVKPAIGFVDDRPEHVAAAITFGWTAGRYSQDPGIFFDLAGLSRPVHYGGTDA